MLMQGSQSRADIIELLQSPPFRQQLDTFTHVSLLSVETHCLFVCHT